MLILPEIQFINIFQITKQTNSFPLIILLNLSSFFSFLTLWWCSLSLKNVYPVALHLFIFFSPNHFSPAVLYPLSTHALLHTNESLSSRQPKKKRTPSQTSFFLYDSSLHQFFNPSKNKNWEQYNFTMQYTANHND